jgi:hypothetical protein
MSIDVQTSAGDAFFMVNANASLEAKRDESASKVLQYNSSPDNPPRTTAVFVVFVVFVVGISG